MKYIYIICYEDPASIEEIDLQRRQLNQYFMADPVKKVVCGYDSFVFHLLDEAISKFNVLVSVQSEFHTNHDFEYNQTILSTFENEILLPDSPVVFIMNKQHARYLLTYINPVFTELDEVTSHELGLFRIVCESDHIGIERLWTPFLKPITDL